MAIQDFLNKAAQMFNPDKDMPELDSVMKSVTGDDHIEIDPDMNKRYRNDMDNAIKFHKKVYYKFAKKYYNYLRSKLTDNELSDLRDEGKLEGVFCNEFWINIKTLIPSIYFNNPKAVIQADSKTYIGKVPNPTNPVEMIETKIPIDPKAAELLESTIAAYYKKLRLKKNAKRAVLDAAVAGFGVLKAGWRTTLKDVEANDLGLVDDDMTGGYFPSINFMPDPECTNSDLTDAKYIVLRYWKPTEYIKNSPLYKGVKDLKGTRILKFSGGDKDNNEDDEMYSQNNGSNTPDVERNQLFEIFHLETHKLVVYVDGIDKPIRYDDWTDTRYPVSILSFNDDPEYFYPIPDFRAYESQVLIKTKLRRKMVKLFLQMNAIFGVDEDVFKKDKVQAVLDSDDGGVVPFKNPQNKPAGQILMKMNDFMLNESHTALQALLDVDIAKLSGVSEQAKGMVQKSKALAAEVYQQAQQMNLRIEEKKDCIADWLEDYTLLMIYLLQENVQGERETKMIKDAGVDFVSWTKENIMGKFGVSIDVGSMVKQNPEMKMKLADKQYQQLSQSPLMNQVWLLKENLKAGGTKDMTEALNKQTVAKYENPQLGMVIDALQSNPQLMQSVTQIVQQQAQMGQGGAPVPQGGQTPPTPQPQASGGISAMEARTGQVNPINTVGAGKP